MAYLSLDEAFEVFRQIEELEYKDFVYIWRDNEYTSDKGNVDIFIKSQKYDRLYETFIRRQDILEFWEKLTIKEKEQLVIYCKHENSLYKKRQETLRNKNISNK
jgi:hypothetical protein